MKIESNGEKISVALSVKDMNELNITYDELDYSNIETRRVIWTILDEARRTLGKSINTDGRLIIEVAPLDEGGCILHFTSTPLDSKSKKRLIMKKDTDPLLFRAFSEDAFIDASTLLKRYENAFNSAEFYIYNNEFFISIRPKFGFSDMLHLVFCEFGEIDECSAIEISKFREYSSQSFDC